MKAATQTQDGSDAAAAHVSLDGFMTAAMACQVRISFQHRLRHKDYSFLLFQKSGIVLQSSQQLLM